MSSPAALTTAITAELGELPWPDHEYVRGWGVFGLPFASGHVLALRVFPQTSFGQAMWPIRDREEYESARREARAEHERSTR